jgi:hypothetical protein
MESGADRLILLAPARVSIWAELRERPSLLGLELLWRWLCGGSLLLVAGFDATRIWAAAQPALQATGLFQLSSDSLLDDPLKLLTIFTAVMNIVRPQVERAAWGLAPFALFCWLVAFALGRQALLARYDARLPHRPWLLAGTEGLRLAALLIASYAWSAAMDGASALSLHGAAPNVLLYALLVLAATVLLWWLWARVARALELCVVLALADGLLFSAAYQRAWTMPRAGLGGRLRMIRRAQSRARLWLLVAALVLTLLPDPFAQFRARVGWGMALTLALLGAGGAVRLGVLFASLGAVREARAASALPHTRPFAPSPRL